MTDLTCIITGHREGHLAVASLRSFLYAKEAALQAGISIQALYILDKPDDVTLDVFSKYADGELRTFEFGDQGMARNAAIEISDGRLCAFLDADDLWTQDWLIKSEAFIKNCSDDVIAHPQFNYFFEAQASIFCHIDQEDAEFSLDALRLGNYWDALCVCPTYIYREIPFAKRDIENGWAYEDWKWNCETVSAGKIHKIVPDTVLFKRRQKLSQTIRASQNHSMIKMGPMSDYSHSLYRE